MPTLVLLRHGESQANHDNIFTGWTDAKLTSHGINQAYSAGKIINNMNIQFEDVHTSFLIRAIDTANIVLDEIDQAYIPEHKTWRLNERHYGALRGKNKTEVKKQVGEKQFKLWRRSFKVVPPLLKHRHQEDKYTKIGVKEPLGESLENTYNRLLPYWIDEIAPRLLDNHNQLIVAHGSTLRALIKYLENVPDNVIDSVEVPNGVPIKYELDNHLNILNKKIIK